MLPWLLGFDYRDVVMIAFISSDIQFEITITTATVVFGVSSEVALATMIRLSWEAPSMLTLMKIALKPKIFSMC